MPVESERSDSAGSRGRAAARFRVGDLDVDLGRQQVQRGGVALPLARLSFDLLVALVRAAPDVVSLDELMGAVWRDVAVSTETVSQRVKLLRDALGDDARKPRYVAGLRGRGYRLIPPVTRVLERAATEDGESEALLLGREAYERRDWEAAYRELKLADATRPLVARDLEQLSWAAFWSARYAETIPLLERAEAAHLRDGDARGAARVLARQARLHFDQRNFAVGGGLWARARKLLEGLSEGPEHGEWAAWTAGMALALGQPPQARQYAQHARAIARRVGDPDAEALGLLVLGRCDLVEGRLATGIALCDEASAAATSGELSLFVAGCAALNEYRARADWQRAAEWTERASRWCEREGVAFFPGTCLVHRAEVLRFQGQFEGAERAARRGCELLAPASLPLVAMGYRELAEISLRRGDLERAEAACRDCVGVGFEPQPVLALLLMAQGDVAGAYASLERAFADGHPWHRENRVNLLPAMVSVALAARRCDGARTALEELEALARVLDTPAPRAAAARARGELALFEGRAGEAIEALREAAQAWSELSAPYERARVAALLAHAYTRHGDRRAAAMQLESALATFERLGAACDARAATRELAELASLQAQ